MRRKINVLLLSLSLGLTAITCTLPASGVIAAEADTTGVTMYRLYNPNSGEHFYTGNETEKTDLVKAGWSDEGIGWIAPEKSDTPVYRLYNANAGDHHYTMNAKERDELVSAGWKSEDIGWYSDDAETVPLYREYNPNAVTGTHNYTTDKAEHDGLVKAGWKDEGIGWYAVSDGKSDPIDKPEEPKDPDDEIFQIGDTVILGKYEQDNDLTNGPEPIEWQYVADRDGHKYLLSKYVLDYKPYNSANEDITWEDCTLRKWLNEDFYDTAFSPEDKKKIVAAHNENPDSYELFKEWEQLGRGGADGGNDTDDNVFLMSWTEAENYLDGKMHDNNNDNLNQKLVCVPTLYAVEKGGLTSERAYWWLRSPGDVQFNAVLVFPWGSLTGRSANTADIGVRPTILID